MNADGDGDFDPAQLRRSLLRPQEQPGAHGTRRVNHDRDDSTHRHPHNRHQNQWRPANDERAAADLPTPADLFDAMARDFFPPVFDEMMAAVFGGSEIQDAPKAGDEINGPVGFPAVRWRSTAASRQSTMRVHGDGVKSVAKFYIS